eukprot:364109-Chlamydomonas_euryale.AAC.4
MQEACRNAESWKVRVATARRSWADRCTQPYMVVFKFQKGYGSMCVRDSRFERLHFSSAGFIGLFYCLHSNRRTQAGSAASISGSDSDSDTACVSTHRERLRLRQQDG